MKITIYELLGMVKDEPDRSIYVKYFDRINKKEDVMWACKENIIYKLNQLIIELNDKVEILEEEKKIPEKLEEPRFNKGRYYIKDINGDDSEISGIERTFRLKINEIIDYLKSKGE